MDGTPGDPTDPLDAYLEALRRQLNEPPSELTERRHIRAIATAGAGVRRRLRSHTVGRIAALALGAVLVAFNGSALADALPSVHELASGIGRAVSGVFEGSADDSGWDDDAPVVALPVQVEDPVAQPARPPAEPGAGDNATPEATVEPTQPPAEPEATTVPPPEVVWTGEICDAKEVTLRLTDPPGGVEMTGLGETRIQRRDSGFRIGFDGGSVMVRAADDRVDVVARCDRDRGDEDDRRRRGDVEDDGQGRRDRNNDDGSRDRDDRRGDDGDRSSDGSRWRDRGDDGQGGDR